MEKNAPAKKIVTTKDPKATKQPKAPKVPKDPKPRVPRKPSAERKTQTSKVLKDSGMSGSCGTKRKRNDEVEMDDEPGGVKREKHIDCSDGESSAESGPSNRIKPEV